MTGRAADDRGGLVGGERLELGQGAMAGQDALDEQAGGPLDEIGQFVMIKPIKIESVRSHQAPPKIFYAVLADGA
ncbi:hypothetical protein [Nonomuraea sp. NPDC049695]|uniref:hypothetical protein n=1 Tax=Nonomuraea sp. NPDC049695 TaxID=3154734 RepID=UPI00343EACE1